MGGTGHSVFFLLYVLCVLWTLFEAESQKTSDCARWCPLNSRCVNATACRCSPGFTSLSGDIFTSRLENCDDINECGPPLAVSCGKFADCQNTEGSYHCECSPGYQLASGAKTFRNESENTCQGVDKCQLKPRLCKGRSICINTQGNYTCGCPPGLELNLSDPNVCSDVDECSSWPPACHNSTVCVNTVGSYRCRCRRGWELKPGFQNKQTNTTCQEMSFPAWTEPPGIKSQRLSDFFKTVQVLRRDFKPALAQGTIQNLIMSVDELLEVPSDLDALALPERHKMATHLLSELERVLRTLAKAMPGASFTYHSPLNTELALMIQEQGDGYTTIGQSHARMLLDWAVAAAARDSDPTVMGILSSWKMQKLLANASLELDPEMKAKLKDLHQSPVRGAKYKLLSAVNLVFLSNTNTEHLDSPVTFAFSHRMETPGPRQGLVCAFWKSDDRGGGHWNTTGCWTRGTSDNSTTCQCNHLSSFAVLMAHYDIEDPKLALITKVGLALSLVCLLLCILTFLLVRPIQGSRTTVHLHLCICLFVGSAIFLAGIENEGRQVGLRCRLVAGLLHYCFLAAFCWMSLEGLELYFLVVRVFHGQGLSKCWLYLIGYGVPLLIVAISAAVRHERYGRSLYCWLDPEDGFLWSFLGPVIFIVLFNAVIFVTTVWKLTQKFSEINPDMKKLKKARVLTITAVAQLFLLGSTWVFGLFLFNPHSWVLSYTFTILNCLQGFFLFIFHCLLNKKVREEYRKWAGWVTGNRYSEFTTSSSNQTQAHRPSESGM
ncbi:adhesion G protein-coupled receptor E5 isoform X3 [Neofelis nebulosa]|uniref:adhesion G protein-coupled receptor E5 isoform X3 n=1 Tax=Neofelis nebulosa TaxID=61452 RepID=UPI00272BFC4D|nr:adhesion G protein-coupled receptor E5 isoform X3 [Neofelis nebulosa]